MARRQRQEWPMARRAGAAPRAGQRGQGPPRLSRLVGPAVLVLIGGAAIAAAIGLPGGPTDRLAAVVTATPTAPVVGQASPTATARPPLVGGSSTVATPRPSLAPRPSATPTPAPPLPTPTASATPRPRDWAPQRAADFDIAGQVVDITFPLKPGARYRYRDNWHDLRPGEPEPYNHLHSRKRGELRRAHDGIDIYVRRGSPVLAPFAGTVIDPATRWQPWRRDRFGTTVVIVSNEPQSAGYAALLAHLDVAFVEPGTVVRRGEVIGLAGDSGNADGARVHVHFELRAPFLLAWSELGEERLLDAFNPYPSLVRSDPRRD
jgi:murein DD-endopeptidase MepM/ murein hydrolase activator NlpD